MRFFLTLLILISGVSVAQAAEKKQTFCQKAKDFETELYVFVNDKKIDFDFTKSVSDLTNKRKDALDEWADKHEDAVWSSAHNLRVHGLNRAGVGVETEARMIAQPYDKYGVYYCPYIQKLEIRFYYNSTIFVASDFKKGTCDFDEIMKHEMKHHDINIAVIEETITQFKKDLPEMVKFLERKYIKKEEVGKKFGQMKLSVRDAFEIYADIIVKEMTKRNDLLDTPEEYEKVGAACQ